MTTQAVATMPPESVVEVQAFDLTTYIASLGEEGLARQRELMNAYNRAVLALVGEDDIQLVEMRERGKTVTKKLKKKSAWSKLASHFRISSYPTQIETMEVGGGHLHSRAIVRAIAPWGQSVACVGGCSTEEKRFQYDRSRARHDCEATAETRAHNRAIARLIAAGEVSAEEMEGGAAVPRRAPAREVRVPDPNGPSTGDITDAQHQELANLLGSEKLSDNQREWIQAKAGHCETNGQMEALLRAVRQKVL